MTLRVEILNPKAAQLVQSLVDLKLITVQPQDDFEFSKSQKALLDERRMSNIEEDYISWTEAKKQLKIKTK